MYKKLLFNFFGGSKTIILVIMMLLCTVMSAAGAAHPCLTLSNDGTTVIDSNGCTVLTAADWGTATKIADGVAFGADTYTVFMKSRSTLTSIEFPSNFEYIGDAAFSGCYKLTGSLTIPNSVTTIGDAAFRDCRNLTGDLTIPSSVTTLGKSAFQGCSGFKGSLTIPNSITTLEHGVFEGCKGFTGNLTIPSSVTSIQDLAFSLCRGFTGSLTIPSSVTFVGDWAFMYCTGIDGILFTNKTATVEAEAFLYAPPVYLYADSTWINDGDGTKVPFITAVSAADSTVAAGGSSTVTVSSDQPSSDAYIPSISYASSNPTVATVVAASTGKGVMTNTINGIADGTSTITITAAQVGSDIFGAANVPAIPSITIPVTVTGSNIPTTGGDGGNTGVSENQNSPDLSHYEPAVYAAPEITANGNTSLTITNTHYPELINVTVVKYWTDDDNRDYLRPEAICLTLTAAADSVSEDVWNHTLNASNADVNDNNKWQYVFEDLVKYYDGYQIAYTLGEASGECTNQVTKTIANCEISGGKWENNACTPFSLYDPNSQHGSAPAEYNDQASCEAASHTWMSAFCSDNSYSNQEDCANAGETWNEGRCAVN